MDDEKIIRLYEARDERALAETDAKYGRYCKSVAFNILHDEPSSGEVVNDSYLATWNAIPPTRPRSLLAFVSKIVRNLSLKRYRFDNAKKRGEGKVESSLDELAEVVASSSAADAVEELEAKELAREISVFLSQQTEDVRRMFMMRYFEFSSIAEIADSLGFTQSKVKMTLKRTRDALAGHLERKGYLNA